MERNLRFTYKSFRDECNLVARGMMALGIGKGHHVGIWFTNYTEWIVAQFATAKIGAVPVTLNPAHRTHDLEYALRQSDADALVCPDAMRILLIGVTICDPYVGNGVMIVTLTGPQHVIGGSWTSLEKAEPLGKG